MRKYWTGSRWALGTMLSAAAVTAWMGFAAGQEEATVAQRPVAKPNAVSFQMHPVTADISNSDEQRLNADADQDNWRLHARRALFRYRRSL